MAAIHRARAALLLAADGGSETRAKISWKKCKVKEKLKESLQNFPLNANLARHTLSIELKGARGKKKRGRANKSPRKTNARVE